MTQINLVDINYNMVEAWKKAFANCPEVNVYQGNIIYQAVDVWVTPTNSKGHMSGGVDAAIRDALGHSIEGAVQNIIQVLHGGLLPVGKAVIVATSDLYPILEYPKFVVATPSMVGESDNLRRTKNTALACAAAFQAIYQAQDKFGATIESIAIPGLGSGTGQVPPDTCAELMLIGYKLFQRKRYDSFDEMLTHLNEELTKVGLEGAAKAGPQPDTGVVAQVVAGSNGHPEGINIESHHQTGGVTAHTVTGGTINVAQPFDTLDGVPVTQPQDFDVVFDSVVLGKETQASPAQPEAEETDYMKNMPIGTPLF